jgi:hypothetical protein
MSRAAFIASILAIGPVGPRGFRLSEADTLTVASVAVRVSERLACMFSGRECSRRSPWKEEKLGKGPVALSAGEPAIDLRVPADAWYNLTLDPGGAG